MTATVLARPVRAIRRVLPRIMIGAALVGLVAARLASAEPAPAPPAATVRAGSAFSSAGVTTVGPSYGGLAIVVTAGFASAYYQGATAQATSQAVNAAALSGLAGTGGGIPALDGLKADSANGPAAHSGGGPLVGTEEVSVNPSPESARSTTHAALLEIPGVLKVDGQAAAGVAYTEGRRQASDADVTMSIDLMGGLVTLDAVAWHAAAARGEQPTTAASFSLGRLTLGGTVLPIATPAQLTSSITAVNRLLAPLGISLLLPTKSVDPTSGTVTMSPLELRMARSELTNKLLGPLLDPASKLELALADALAKGGAGLASVASTIGTGALLGGLVLGILAGAGKVSLALGGVSAGVQDAPGFADPLGGTTPGATDGSSTPPAAFGPFPSGSVAPLLLSAPPPAPASSRIVGTGPVHCTTTSAAGRPGCWRGAGTVAASALLVAGIALFAADLRASRRRRVPVEVPA